MLQEQLEELDQAEDGEHARELAEVRADQRMHGEVEEEAIETR